MNGRYKWESGVIGEYVMQNVSHPLSGLAVRCFYIMNYVIIVHRSKV